MPAILNIRSEQIFRTKLVASDYEIYRDGFCLMLTTQKSRQHDCYLSHQDLVTMLASMIEFFTGYPMSVPPELIEGVLVGVEELTPEQRYVCDWAMPTDEMIIQYCIDQALIPHPYEEYG